MHERVGSESHRAAVFKFNFGAAADACADLCALRDREIKEGSLESLTVVLVDLDGTLNIAEADNARL